MNLINSKERLTQMAKEMIRKDFEVFRVQDRLYEFFKDAEFFSHHNDEFLSVQHAVELAFGKTIKAVDETLWGFICDCSVALAFDYKTGSQNILWNIKLNASTLADLIFRASEKDDVVSSTQDFLNGFIKKYPHLELKQARKYLTEVSIEKEFVNEGNGMGCPALL